MSVKPFASLESRLATGRWITGMALGALVLAGLCATSLASYLLFHTLVEMLTIVVAVSIFLIVWNTRRSLTSNYVAFLGIAYVFVAAIDFAHTLTYSGMEILPQFTSNVPTQLWIAARALQSISFLVAPLYFKRKLRFGVATLSYFLVSSILISMTFEGSVFPVCFVDGVGLTLFKKLSEYVISLLLVVGWFRLYQNRARLERSVFVWLSVSILLAVVAELAFTFYISVYGLSNLVGPVLKLFSFFALYKAIVETALRIPYDTLFRELKASERAFEQERDFAEGIINTAQVIVLVLDEQGRIVRFNPYMEALSGYRLEEVRGKDWFSTFIPQRDQSSLRQLFNVARSGQPTRNNVSAIVTRSREERQVEWGDAACEDTDGSSWLICIGRDITDSLRAEEERRRLEAQLRQTQRLQSVGTLASGVAHEINNPLMGIINYAELISDEGVGSEIGDYAKGIIQEGNRAATIVRNLLSFSRQDEGSSAPENIREIVDASLSLISALLKKDQILVIVSVDDDLPAVTCRKQQIQQVMINLLSNAQEALNRRYPSSDEDKILSISARAWNRNGGAWIRLTVEDHGTGIPQDDLERIFDPFYTTKSRAEGTGLGLSVSYGIVKAHKGELVVESEPYVYTRFHIDLPVNVSEGIPDDMMKTTRPKRSSSDG